MFWHLRGPPDSFHVFIIFAYSPNFYSPPHVRVSDVTPRAQAFRAFECCCCRRPSYITPLKSESCTKERANGRKSAYHKICPPVNGGQASQRAASGVASQRVGQDVEEKPEGHKQEVAMIITQGVRGGAPRGQKIHARNRNCEWYCESTCWSRC